MDFKARTAESSWSFIVPPIGTFEVRLIDELLYQKAPAGFSVEGRPWQKIDLRGVGLDRPNQPSIGEDSILSLSYLRGLSRDVTVIGSEHMVYPYASAGAALLPNGQVLFAGGRKHRRGFRQ